MYSLELSLIQIQRYNTHLRYANPGRVLFIVGKLPRRQRTLKPYLPIAARNDTADLTENTVYQTDTKPIVGISFVSYAATFPSQGKALLRILSI